MKQIVKINGWEWLYSSTERRLYEDEFDRVGVSIDHCTLNERKQIYDQIFYIA